MCKSIQGIEGDRISLVEQEIATLHDTLENQGINSRGTTDIFGRKFHVPVNAEHKATKFTASMLFSTAQPHMRTFWAATFGFFTTFFSVFSPAGLMPYLRKPKEDGGLGLTLDEVSTSGSLAIFGTIFMRFAAGPMCDKLGARKTFILLLTIAIPGMAILMACHGATPFILGRIMVGFSLATFVTCQVWCSQMFDRTIVGTVNATAGGWGNLGGGITILLIPQIMESFVSSFEGSRGLAGAIDISWRLCFVIPLVMHIVAAIFIWTGRDLADGSYAELELSGAKQKSSKVGTNTFDIVKYGWSNTNALILMITYGLCFGVELTMNNKLVGLFNRYYAIKPRQAGILAATFSLMNLFARSWGGILSDILAKRYGMRGRLSSMWVIQTMCGVMCLIIGCITVNKLNPDSAIFKGAPKVQGIYVDDSGLDTINWYINGTKGLIKPCGSDYIPAPLYGWANNQTYERFPIKERFMIKDPNPECIHNGNTLGVTMICVIVFSLFVQMAEGLHFGVVPYVSRPALGVVSGMVGAGGNFGGYYSSQWIIKAGAPIDKGFIYLGIVIMTVSCIMHFLFFPGEGGILIPKNFPYDPQWIKPPSDAKGSDELNFDAVDVKGSPRSGTKDNDSA